jgi:hypothetical protein
MHAMSKAHYTPTAALVLEALENQAEAEAVAGTFKAQEVATTLWAYATMGREPGAGVMRVLEGRADALANTFNAQNVANTLWKCAKMGREPGDEEDGWAGGGAGGIEDPPLAYKLLRKTQVRSCPRMVATCAKEVREFVATMKRKRAADEEACAVKKAPNQEVQR